MPLITEQEMLAKRGQRFLRWTQNILLMAGVLALCYVALTLLYAKLYQNAANHSLDQQIQAEEQQPASPSMPPMKEGDLLGKIEIPRLGLSVAVLQGTSYKTLLLGVGHIKGTAYPGESGNVGMAGHRDTYFRALKDIRMGDEIQIQTATGLSRYEVDWVKIVAPTENKLLAPSAESALTLVTCYPFYYIGAAPKRYVVHARRQ
jgi:sortase A